MKFCKILLLSIGLLGLLCPQFMESMDLKSYAIKHSSALVSHILNHKYTYLGIGALACLGGIYGGYSLYRKAYQQPQSQPQIKKELRSLLLGRPLIVDKNDLLSKREERNKRLLLNEMSGIINEYKNLKKFILPTNEYPAYKINKMVPSTTPLAYETLDKLVDLFFCMMQRSVFNKQDYWINHTNPQQFLNHLSNNEEEPQFNPFMQKIVVNPGSQIAFQGDLHGDVHSLLASLDALKEKGYLDENYKIIKDNFYLAFLGDYVDKGIYGLEVISVIMYLKCLNFNKVLLVRGNHEDWYISGTDMFDAEICRKFQLDEDNDIGNKYANITKKIKKMYECLPVAIFYGVRDTTNTTNYLLLCHGAVEWGVNTHNLLSHNNSVAFEQIKSLNRKTELNNLMHNDEIFKKLDDFVHLDERNNTAFNLHSPDYEVSSIAGGIDDGKAISFVWGDYIVKSDAERKSATSNFKFILPGRLFQIGEYFNWMVLKGYSTPHHKVRGVFRGHQHAAEIENPMMQSIFKRISFDSKTSGSEIDEYSHDYKENAGVSKLWLSSAPPNTYALWDNIVCTFNVSPCTTCQQAGIIKKNDKTKHKFNFTTLGMLTTASAFEDWKLDVSRIKIFNKNVFQELQAQNNKQQ